MVARNVFRMVSSHQTRDLECFADSSNTPWNPTTILCPDLVATAPQMSLLSLCAPLFRQSHVFLICVVLTHNDSRIIPRKTCQNFQELSVWMTFGFLVGSRNFNRLLLGLLGSFCFARVGLSPLGCQIVYHNSVSMIVSGFAFFTENFVIRGGQITQIFRFGHDNVFCKKQLLLSSSRCHNFGLSVSDCGYCACPDPIPLLLAAPLVIREKSWVNIDVVEHSDPPDSLWNPAIIPANLAIDRCVVPRRHHFYLCFRFLLTHATGFSATLHSQFHFFLLLDSPCYPQYPAMKMLKKQVKMK